MTVKLWTTHFRRICLANLFLFISIYVLFPVLSLAMAERLGVPVTHTGLIFLFFTVGMFLIAPFHAYLVDAYKRKYVGLLSFTVMIAATVGYNFVVNMTELILLSTVQGIAFGLATTVGITLSIDVTSSTLRSTSNVHFSWIARFGMIIGVALGVWVYQIYGWKNVLTVSALSGVLGMFLLSGVYAPFRAPIVTKLCSFDRFLLLRGWVPAINIILITFVPGLLISQVHPSLNHTLLIDAVAFIPLFVGVGIGFALSLVLSRFILFSFRYFSFKENSLRLIIMGIALEALALSLLNLEGSILLSSILLGVGLGVVMPEFLTMFVKLSLHCQRGTANTTHLLACETGIALGIVASCYLDADTVLSAGHIVACAALLFFILITYPYYRKRRIR